VCGERAWDDEHVEELVMANEQSWSFLY